MNYLLQTVISGRYEFLPVPDVFAGVNELRRRDEIELIIIDVDYSTEENWDFIEHINTSGLHQKPVIVLMSGKSKRTDQRMVTEKVYDYFFKPFSPPDLLRVIDRLMVPKAISI